MKEKKFIKLINNEKANRRISSEKACDTTSYDDCYIDYIGCTSYSTDECLKLDKSGCANHAYDICDEDYVSCSDGSYDKCPIDNCLSDNCTIDYD